MLLGLSLFYVGAVLILNGLWMLGRIGDREIAVINLFTGTLTLLVSLKLAFGDGADAASIKGAALSLLFSFTYLWVAFNRLTGADGRGLQRPIARLTATLAIGQGVVTGWLPGHLLLTGVLR